MSGHAWSDSVSLPLISMPSGGWVPHPKGTHVCPLLGEMVGNRLRECLFVKLADRCRQDPRMRCDEHVPGLHGDPEAVQEAKVTLVGRNEDAFLCRGILEVKRVIPLPQTKLHRRGDVMTVLCEERRKGYGHTFVQIELGHRLRYGRLTGFDSLRDLLLVLCIVAEGSLHF